MSTRPVGRPPAKMVGEVFGRLTVLSMVPGRARGGHVVWNCSCKCGGPDVTVVGYQLRQGKTTSCGCWRSESARDRATTHGQSNTRLYKVWRSMIARCDDENATHYDRYGGRGIDVCQRWRDGYMNFIQDMGVPEKGMEIDRKDNDGDYEKSNCRWVTHTENANNTSRNARVTHEGMCLTVSQWAILCGQPKRVIYYRLKKGLSIPRVLRKLEGREWLQDADALLNPQHPRRIASKENLARQ